MSEIKLYDTEARMELVMNSGPRHYTAHVNHMTTEDLRSKSDIAVELAWRDLRIEQLVSENTALTDKAASELSNAWLLHKYWVGIQVALMYIRAGKIDDATEWLVGTVSGPGIEAPDLIFTAEIESWAEIQQKDIISHAQAVEIIKAEMSATTQAISEIKTQSRIESTYFTANRLLAAFEHGFIDKPEKEVADIALMILESAKYMPSAQPEEFTKTYSDQVLARIAASLRGNN